MPPIRNLFHLRGFFTAFCKYFHLNICSISEKDTANTYKRVEYLKRILIGHFVKTSRIFFLKCMHIKKNVRKISLGRQRNVKPIKLTWNAQWEVLYELRAQRRWFQEVLTHKKISILSAAKCRNICGQNAMSIVYLKAALNNEDVRIRLTSFDTSSSSGALMSSFLMYLLTISF